MDAGAWNTSYLLTVKSIPNSRLDTESIAGSEEADSSIRKISLEEQEGMCQSILSPC